jgi:arylsulfatase A-like enzyme
VSRRRSRAAAVLSVIALTAACTKGVALTTASSPRGPTGSTAPTASPSTHRPPARPNILIVLTDDQRAGTLDVMPKTRRIFAGGGTLYLNGFVTTPLCCPSRATILSGRYDHNNGVLGNGDALRLDQDTTIERYLQDAGYRTGIVGKFLNTWPLDQNPPHWDSFDIFNNGYFNTLWNLQGKQATVSQYATSFISDHAVRFLRQSESDDEQPWFLYVATSAPHDPWIPEPKYANAPVPPFVRNPAMLEADISDKPPWVQDAVKLTPADIARNRADQLRTQMSVDDMVGRIFRVLRQLGEDRNTLAFFLSDNGFLWGEHQVAGDRSEQETTVTKITGKRLPYTQSIHVPFLVRWPGHVRSGVQDPRFVANVDIAPTIMDAAGLSPPASVPMDGRSLLSGPTRREMFLEYFLDPIYPVIPSWASIRTTTRQYVEYYDPSGRVIFREYYDLARDPFQLNNLFGDASASDDPHVAGLSRQLRADLRCVGTTGADPCP